MELEVNDSGEDRRQSSVSFKEGENKETLPDPASPTPKVPKKFINNWRQACDRTKDRTKELLKKWRTLPEGGQTEITSVDSHSIEGNAGNSTKWTEHVWTTWVKRNSSEEEQAGKPVLTEMTDVQKKKFEHFFIFYLDLDRDDVISLADFDAFSERLRHFSDWSKNSAEYHRLKEVQRGFIETFLLPKDLEERIHSYELLEKKLKKEQLSLEQWYEKWALVLTKCQNFYELPLWLQYFPKILFNVINKSGDGVITKDELSNFFSSILGLTSVQLASFANSAFDALTSSNRYPLNYSVYRLCFANFVFAKYPNGPGQFIFGPITSIQTTCFPIDYKTLNCAPQELEQYSPKVKSNRRSVIV